MFGKRKTQESSQFSHNDASVSQAFPDFPASSAYDTSMDIPEPTEFGQLVVENKGARKSQTKSIIMLFILMPIAAVSVWFALGIEPNPIALLMGENTDDFSPMPNEQISHLSPQEATLPASLAPLETAPLETLPSLETSHQEALPALENSGQEALPALEESGQEPSQEDVPVLKETQSLTLPQEKETGKEVTEQTTSSSEGFQYVVVGQEGLENNQAVWTALEELYKMKEGTPQKSQILGYFNHPKVWVRLGAFWIASQHKLLSEDEFYSVGQDLRKNFNHGQMRRFLERVRFTDKNLWKQIKTYIQI